MARTLAIALITTALAFTVVAGARYPGTMLVFVLFNICFFACAALAFPAPRLYGYLFLAALLTLGLWSKALVHTIWNVGFLEPVGNFADSPGEWDSAMLAMSCAALGVAAPRALHLWFRRRQGRRAATTGAVPAWFSNWRRPLWIATIAGLVAVNVANVHFAFFQIGVNPKVLLPLRLHVVLSWLVNVGFALWISALLWWDYLANPATLRRTLFAPLVEALLSSISAFSRIVYLIHGAAYWLVVLEERRRFAAVISRRTLMLLIGSFVLLFIVGLAAVFVLRAGVYPANADLARNVKLEIPQLVVRRWVGLEGVLAVGGAKERGAALLQRAVTDSAKAGTESLYQRVAKTRYKSDETGTFAFLTNAGPVAILLFSGSLTVVFVGMGILVLVLMLFEEIAYQFTGNPFLQGVAGAALANVLSQTTFFYLTFVFFLQMVIAVGVIAMLTRIGK